MRLLLDTHIALRAITDSPRLPARARELILAPASEIFVSAASVWEIAFKHTLNRGNMPVSGAEAARYFTEAGYVLLPITAEHAAATGTLPRLHADPFDRILIAQAITEPLRLMTCDATVAKYGDLMLPV
ncbi:MULTISPECIES: type II toxin-antitoxin system VapC family toxin [unclassified Methylococcus]|uniref:type II toxin-antitoxin system VapC family toxin n=1 Tax=unclassified Methylococcus TaxID=2618889 RepID=UPI003D7D54C0